MDIFRSTEDAHTHELTSQRWRALLGPLGSLDLPKDGDTLSIQYGSALLRTTYVDVAEKKKYPDALHEGHLSQAFVCFGAGWSFKLHPSSQYTHEPDLPELRELLCDLRVGQCMLQITFVPEKSPGQVQVMGKAVVVLLKSIALHIDKIRGFIFPHIPSECQPSYESLEDDPHINIDIGDKGAVFTIHVDSLQRVHTTLGGLLLGRPASLPRDVGLEDEREAFIQVAAEIIQRGSTKQGNTFWAFALGWELRSEVRAAVSSSALGDGGD